MYLKIISRILFPFINLGFIFKLLVFFTRRRNRPFVLFEGKTYTYKDVYVQARKYEQFFRAAKRDKMRRGLLKRRDALAVGLYMDNTPEFVFAVFGASMCGATIFGINTGFRGQTLINVIDQARCSLLIVTPNYVDEVEKILPDVRSLCEREVYVIGDAATIEQSGFNDIQKPLSDPKIQNARHFRKGFNHWTPLIVIYTSGTTGAPKGVPRSHLMLIGALVVVNSRIHLRSTDRGYVCMPLFHSNAWFVGILPLLGAGGSFLLKSRFSASAFEQDLLDYGVTYMNYVGQPIHYILVALENKYGNPNAVEQALANHPHNKFRLAHGNGAPTADRVKLKRYLNMEHVYELYGSTEAAITTTNQPDDPIDSLGVVRSPKIVILDETDKPCPYGAIDEKGNLTNYDEAVGEICKKVPQNNVIFDGYFNNKEANNKKFRDGYFHSGDLGHLCLINGKRYLYFDGRTDDWIRKDGENFSAENVLQYAAQAPGVALAAAYGAPSEVSDEKVMVAVQMHEGASFDPKKTYDWYIEQQADGGMDPKWMPDYIRIVDSFEMTHQTQKILVRPLKRQHFNIERDKEMKLFFRRRGDETFHELKERDFASHKDAFRETGRTNLLDNW